jgi:hypothetical protein
VNQAHATARMGVWSASAGVVAAGLCGVLWLSHLLLPAQLLQSSLVQIMALSLFLCSFGSGLAGLVLGSLGFYKSRGPYQLYFVGFLLSLVPVFVELPFVAVLLLGT